MRTPGQNNRPLIPGTAIEGAPPTQIVLAFDDNRLASALFGQYGQNLALIERRLNVVADSRGNHVTIFNTHGLIDRRTIDPTRTYQPSGRPPGRPPKHPH